MDQNGWPESIGIRCRIGSEFASIFEFYRKDDFYRVLRYNKNKPYSYVLKRVNMRKLFVEI